MSYISCLCCERTPNRSCWYWHTDSLVLTNKKKLITPIHEVYSFQAPWSTYKLYSDNPIAIIINVIIITLCFIRGKRWETLRITNRNICNSCVVRKAVILSDVWHKIDSDHSSYSLTRGTSNCYLAFSSLVFFFYSKLAGKSYATIVISAHLAVVALWRSRETGISAKNFSTASSSYPHQAPQFISFQ